jgi:nitrile hydratase
MASYDSDKIAHIHHELHSHLPAEPALRVKTLESLLVEKSLLGADAVDVWLEKYAEQVGPKNGAQVIARAWLEPDFAERLRQDGMQGFIELGIVGEESGYELEAVFNTAEVHNLVVCTLCSCYPLRLIGMSPTWYKSNEYRARAVRCAISGSKLAMMWRCGCGIPHPSDAIWWCRNGPPAPKAGRRTNLPPW